MSNTDSFPKFLSEIFLIANKTYSSIEDFVTSFLLSKDFKRLLNNFNKSYLNTYKEFYKFKYIDKKIDVSNKISNDIVAYIGFIYGKFLLTSNESINKILKILPVKNVIKNYDLYHTLSEERVIFLIKYEYNIKMNAIRKLRSKKNPELSFRNEEFNLFIASHLYKKLFSYKETDRLAYKFDEFPYLVSADTFLVSSFVNDVKNIYEYIHNNKFDPYKFNKSNNVLFLFINKEIEVNDVLKDTLINKVNCSIPFDKVFIFDNKKIIFSNIEVPTQLFYLDINKIDIKEINNKYNNRFVIH